MSKTSPAQPRYRFADHVRACHVGGQVILLDLLRGKYIGVGGPLLAAMATEIADWPVNCTALDDAGTVNELMARIEDLRRQGMLAPATTTTGIASHIDEPQQSLYACDQPRQAGVQWRRVAGIACATIVAATWLRRHSLAEIAGKVHRMRPAQSATVSDTRSSLLQSAVAWYLHTRPFMMTSHDECLRDSLTLVRFLATEKLYPNWIIGVRTHPFAAHSWVQAGGLVLNDLHESVRRYTPILVV